MSREAHVRFCEGPQVKFLRSTHPYVSFWQGLVVCCLCRRRFCSTHRGLALFGTIGSSLSRAIANAKTREASLIIFLAAANITLLGIGGVFWRRVIELVAYPVLNGRFPQQALKSAIQPTPTNKKGGVESGLRRGVQELAGRRFSQSPVPARLSMDL
ncbi:hypothetical protein ETQ85_22075 [Zoogloea oleivorans]|uniref:Uncharacterized protein n=1 Tax=Zoogloea oleivorans TaxID=1552750 RepID=A0A6C2CH12_9RHOO|nr:hypothetical protein ETQ85_22075 [Zoogloea oleivorans]